MGRALVLLKMKMSNLLPGAHCCRAHFRPMALIVTTLYYIPYMLAPKAQAEHERLFCPISIRSSMIGLATTMALIGLVAMDIFFCGEDAG